MLSYRRQTSFAFGRLTSVFAVGACVSVALLFFFGYRAIGESRTKSLLLAERQSSENADLLLTALTRDMSGVQTSVLTSPAWNLFSVDHPHEVNELVASAFARYPYPETFFAWRHAAAEERTAFFYRAERRPMWMSATPADAAFPVVIASESKVGAALIERIRQDAARARTLSFFETTLGNARQQVVAQLVYDDVYRQHLSSVVGFTVNVPWVREHYFADLTRQVWNIGRGSESGLLMHIRDGNGQVVAGTTFNDRSPLTHRRTFDLMFLDSETTLPAARDYVAETWSVAVSAARSPSVLQDSINGTRLLAFAGASGLIFALGLVLTVRAARASANLAAMRSDFVSTVTHELKTPIATIKAAAETLERDRLTGMSVRTCGRIVVMESRRLARLVENLLAYSRITDAADTYTFVALDVSVIFNDLQEDFEARLDREGFELDIAGAVGLPPVRGDRFALRLLFGNLVDNAIRYSGAGRNVRLHAALADGRVTIAVADSGIGIDPHELPQVIKRFRRGQHALAGGSGLGLAIADRIASDHHGTLRIESAVGVGTTVTIALPIA